MFYDCNQKVIINEITHKKLLTFIKLKVFYKEGDLIFYLLWFFKKIFPLLKATFEISIPRHLPYSKIIVFI